MTNDRDERIQTKKLARAKRDGKAEHTVIGPRSKPWTKKVAFTDEAGDVFMEVDEKSKVTIKKGLVAEVTAETVEELKTFKPKITVSEDAKLDLKKEEITVSVKVEAEEVAESIPSEEQIDEGIEKIAISLGVPEEFVKERKEDLKAQKEAVIETDAQIAELEAKLAELKKKAE